MAPPHTTSKPASITTQSTARRGGRNLPTRKSSIEQENLITDNEGQTEEMDTDTAHNTLDNSQHAPSAALQKLMANMVDDVCRDDTL